MGGKMKKNEMKKYFGIEYLISYFYSLQLAEKRGFYKISVIRTIKRRMAPVPLEFEY